MGGGQGGGGRWWGGGREREYLLSIKGTDGRATGFGLVLVLGGSDERLLDMVLDRLLRLLSVASRLSILCGLGGAVISPYSMSTAHT